MKRMFRVFVGALAANCTHAANRTCMHKDPSDDITTVSTVANCATGTDCLALQCQTGSADAGLCDKENFNSFTVTSKCLDSSEPILQNYPPALREGMCAAVFKCAAITTPAEDVSLCSNTCYFTRNDTVLTDIMEIDAGKTQTIFLKCNTRIQSIGTTNGNVIDDTCGTGDDSLASDDSSGGLNCAGIDTRLVMQPGCTGQYTGSNWVCLQGETRQCINYGLDVAASVCEDCGTSIPSRIETPMTCIQQHLPILELAGSATPVCDSTCDVCTVKVKCTERAGQKCDQCLFHDGVTGKEVALPVGQSGTFSANACSMPQAIASVSGELALNVPELECCDKVEQSGGSGNDDDGLGTGAYVGITLAAMTPLAGGAAYANRGRIRDALGGTKDNDAKSISNSSLL